MAASVLNGSLSKIIDVPHLKDVSVMIEILQYLGATVTRTEQMLHIDTTNVKNYEVPEYLMRRMRSSIFLMGPILGRFGKVRVSYPGVVI